MARGGARPALREPATLRFQDMLKTRRRSLDLPDDRRRERVEMPRVEEFRSMPKLRRAIAPRSRAASPTRSEIDVALAGEIETVPVSADEHACRSDEPSFTKWAPKQPMGGPRLERRHDAAPTAGRRNGSYSQSPIDGCAHNNHSARCVEAAPSMSSNLQISPGTAAGQQYGCEPDGRKATFIDSIASPFLTCVKRWRCATIIPQAKQRSR